jgi:DNA-binding transcriptional ArsR family regulator
MDFLRILTGEQIIDAIRALNDPSRRRIFNALKAKTMSSVELCEFLAREDPNKEIKPQTVRYHLKELEKGGLVRQDGYEPAGNGDTHIMKKLWRATAENIFIATETAEFPTKEATDLAKSLDIIGTLRQLGFSIPDDASVRETASKYVEWDQLWNKGRKSAEKVLKEISEMHPDVYVSMRRLLSIIQLNDQDYVRYWEISREVTDSLRKAYREGSGKNPEVY